MRLVQALANSLAGSSDSRNDSLSDVLCTDLATVSHQVQAAERSGLVQRRPDPLDGRASRVRLSRRGRNLLDRVRAVQQAELLAAIEQWSPEEQRTSPSSWTVSRRVSWHGRWRIARMRLQTALAPSRRRGSTVSAMYALE